MEQETSTGMFVVNETVDFEMNHFLHFGGVGSSGTGCFRGETGYRAFSHPKACLYEFGVSVVPKESNWQKYIMVAMIAFFLLS